MKTINFAFCALIFLCLMGCGVVKFKENYDKPLPTRVSGESFSKKEIKYAIDAACRVRGWTPKHQDDGTTIASIRLREKHYAKVKITYNEKDINIQYLESEGLGRRDDQIHKNYVRWVNNLHHSIYLILLDN